MKFKEWFKPGTTKEEKLEIRKGTLPAQRSARRRDGYLYNTLSDPEAKNYIDTYYQKTADDDMREDMAQSIITGQTNLDDRDEAATKEILKMTELLRARINARTMAIKLKMNEIGSMNQKRMFAGSDEEQEDWAHKIALLDRGAQMLRDENVKDTDRLHMLEGIPGDYQERIGEN